ncbi:hypothetical protein ACFWBX_01395 [Streptomyces sp. NPDC059991]|uniref:hypothetical protein n=1 Tax=Streptomyces sp. NPDC059991 TaxID=3347028 RepID=UPI0036856FAB
MSTPEERKDDPRVDEQARERSSEQRNITAPTPPDVRAKAHDEDTDEDQDGDGDGDGESEPPAAHTR